MSFVIKSNEFNYKDPSTGEYIGVNVLAERKTIDILQEIDDKAQEILPADYTDLQNMVVTPFAIRRLCT